MEPPYLHQLCAESAEWLIEKGADVESLDVVGYFPLLEAIRWCNGEVAKALLRHGARGGCEDETRPYSPFMSWRKKRTEIRIQLRLHSPPPPPLLPPPTYNSQPYTDAYPSLFEGKWYQGKQRPYGSFVVPRKHAVSLFRKLKERQEVVVMASDIYGKVLKGSHKMVTVTRERVADTAEDIVRE
jgi:hypothetical protein